MNFAIILIFLLKLIDESIGQLARIVGGRQADISEVPYQVSLQYNSDHTCGGSLISKDYILSAAHCVVGRDMTRFSVRMGSNFLTNGGFLIPISAVIRHPSYKASKENYDFSLLRLKTPIKEFSATIKTISLPEANEAYKSDQKAVVSGWGATREGGPTSYRLQVLEVPLISKSVCSSKYPTEITNQMICAGYLSGGRDSCQGESKN